MSLESKEPPSVLMDALERYDARSRQARAERIMWASQKSTLPSAFEGSMVQLRLLEEARVCYVYGRYMAALLCALAFVEHALSEELELRLVERPRNNFWEAIQLARAEGIASPDVLNRVDRLRVVRNTYAHKSADVGENSLYERFRTGKVHPEVVLEADAQASIEVMYEVFLATLRRGV